MVPGARCYICNQGAIGLVRGMPACSACRKFVTRYRHVSLSSLRCEAGGPMANKCDMSRKRTCTKCRLRRSIDLNPTLRLYVETHVPRDSKNMDDGDSSTSERMTHMSALGKLRTFLSRNKQADTSSGSDFNEAGSTGRISAMADQIGAPNTATNLTSQNSAFRQLPFQGTIGNCMQSFSEPVMNSHPPGSAGNGSLDNLSMLALKCIPSTYNFFIQRFIDYFQVCTMDEGQQLVQLGTGLAAVDVDPLQDVSVILTTFTAEEISQTLSAYSSLVMSSPGLSRTAILDMIRNNRYFALLAKTPLQILVKLAQLPIIPVLKPLLLKSILDRELQAMHNEASSVFAAK